MKTLKIDIYPVNEFESACILHWVTRGHYSPEEFAQALREEWDHVVDPSKVRQEHWRNVPQGDAGMISVTCKPGKGAYPVTVVDADDVKPVCALTKPEVVA